MSIFSELKNSKFWKKIKIEENIKRDKIISFSSKKSFSSLRLKIIKLIEIYWAQRVRKLIYINVNIVNKIKKITFKKKFSLNLPPSSSEITWTRDVISF